jgi:hypothetical protein
LTALLWAFARATPSISMDYCATINTASGAASESSSLHFCLTEVVAHLLTNGVQITAYISPMVSAMTFANLNGPSPLSRVNPAGAPISSRTNPFRWTPRSAPTPAPDISLTCAVVIPNTDTCCSPSRPPVRWAVRHRRRQPQLHQRHLLPMSRPHLNKSRHPNLRHHPVPRQNHRKEPQSPLEGQ